MSDQAVSDKAAQQLELQPSDALPVAKVGQPEGVLALISRLAAQPAVDPNVVAKWLEMYERLDARQRQQAYTEALAKLQAELPQMARNGVIPLRTGQIKYAKLEDIDRTIRPMLAREGFSFSFGSDSADGKLFKVSAKLSHREGHSEDFHIHLPIDTGPGRSPVQAVASTLTYARRQLIKMALHIVEKDEDNDGADLERISEEQCRNLESLRAEVGGDGKRLLKLVGVERLQDIFLRDFDRAIAALERKRK